MAKKRSKARTGAPKKEATAEAPAISTKAQTARSPRHKRTPAQRQHDLEVISEMILQGAKQSVIADKLSITQQQISYDLREVRKRWQTNSTLSFDSYVAQEMEKLNLLEREYWDGWKRSQQPRKNSSVSVRERSESAVSEKEAKEESRDGNPRFLEGVLFVLERRARLIGLDKPTRSVVTGTTIDANNLTDEQLQRLANGEPLEALFMATQPEIAARNGAGNRRAAVETKAASRRAQNAPRRSKRG